MDDKDKQILDILKDDSSLTTRQISRKTHLPITTVHNRITKLKQSKAITRFTVDVDPHCVDEGFSVHVLISANLETLRNLGRTQYDLAADLKKISQIKKIDIVSGGPDVIVFLRTKDVQAYDKILLEQIQIIPGISNTQSLITIHEV